MRVKLFVSLLIGWLALSGICLAGLFAFALPQTRLVDIGQIEDFPPANEPYEIFDPVHAYVVNDGAQVIVIDPHTQAPKSYTAYWNRKERKFIDPLTGVWYTLTGRFIRGPERPDLLRYPLVVKDGRLWIRLPRLAGEAVAHE
jgi:hypothetical protein